MFDTDNGDSDSYMDARRAFSDAWHKVHAALCRTSAGNISVPVPIEVIFLVGWQLLAHPPTAAAPAAAAAAALGDSWRL